ncbi:cation-translocating P-type ATPase, partial [Anoxybacillus sp.]
MSWHGLRIEQVAQQADTNMSSGLTEKEAKKRFKQFGANELAVEKKPSALKQFIGQFQDFMVLVLLAATAISAMLGEYIDAIAIVAIVIMNACLGFVQERRAEKSLEALKKLSAPESFVLRDGEWKKVPSAQLVVGDIVKFTSGDRIGADVRIIEAKGLYIEESSLTGESLPVEKQTAPLAQDVALGDRTNMAFMGTLVTKGSGVGIVVGTGMNTAMGQIAHLLQSAPTMVTPLQRKLEQLGKILIVIALTLTALVVVLGVWQGHALYDMFLAGVSLAVAAIPEGLPAIVTVVLALGVQRMMKRNAIVRKLPAVETLGCASVICSDKTGTMTENQMTVTRVWTNNRLWTVSGTGYEPKGRFFYNGKEEKPDKQLQQLLLFGALCNHAEIKKKGKTYMIDGDPTEGALVVSAAKAGWTKEKIAHEFTVEHEFPFDSTRKMMTVIVKDRANRRWIVTKGAPDMLLERCRFIYINNEAKPLHEQERKTVQQTVNMLASEALRTIAIAYRPLS